MNSWMSKYKSKSLFLHLMTIFSILYNKLYFTKVGFGKEKNQIRVL